MKVVRPTATPTLPLNILSCISCVISYTTVNAAFDISFGSRYRTFDIGYTCWSWVISLNAPLMKVVPFYDICLAGVSLNYPAVPVYANNVLDFLHKNVTCPQVRDLWNLSPYVNFPIDVDSKYSLQMQCNMTTVAVEPGFSWHRKYKCITCTKWVQEILGTKLLT